MELIMSNFDKQLSEKEMPKNLTIAKKLAANKYDVYLLSNPNAAKSADFVVKRNNKLYYVEGKTLNGSGSLDHLLAKGASQSDCICVDVIGTNDTSYVSIEIQDAFKNSDISEVWLLKGSRLMKINRYQVQSPKFGKWFKKQWEQSR
jgi:hypothetical protein